MVVFIDGEADRNSYRRFKIKTVEGANDYASHQEMMRRRLAKLGTDEEERFPKPDLIIIDGGKCQLYAVKEVFVKLHEQGLIYRGKRLVNWDPKLQTALSDLEVESDKEEAGSLWHFKYFFEDKSLRTHDGKDHIVVATTRPETLLGDTAVAVALDDERYAHLVGQNIILPITGRAVPIVKDEYVDKEFGTGCVKITPAHDFNDYEVGKRCELPIINIFNKNAEVLAEFEYIAKAGEQISKTIAAPALSLIHI